MRTLFIAIVLFAALLLAAHLWQSCRDKERGDRVSAVRAGCERLTQAVLAKSSTDCEIKLTSWGDRVMRGDVDFKRGFCVNFLSEKGRFSPAFLRQFVISEAQFFSRDGLSLEVGPAVNLNDRGFDFVIHVKSPLP